ncbi:transglutaminase domain-containing protein [Marinilabiliaceae bacterium JC017]|nr:transglutaminase domain-containing protein [Marinilabiliaceae bacterium JC017]
MYIYNYLTANMAACRKKVQYGCFSLLFIVMFSASSCQTNTKTVTDWDRIEEFLDKGELRLVEQITDHLKKGFTLGSKDYYIADSLEQIARRVALDFSLDEQEVNKQLRQKIGEYSQSDKQLWEGNNLLEGRMINGEKRYFKRAVSNLVLLLAHHQGDNLVKSAGLINEDLAEFCKAQSKGVIKESAKERRPVNPVKMKVSYQVTVDPDVVRAGEVIRCWMPWPKESCDRQGAVKLLNVSAENYQIAPDSVGQRSIYMEQIAQKGKPAIFQYQFEYVYKGYYCNVYDLAIAPYDTQAALYKRYTSTYPPHIVFSDDIRNLTDSLTRGETDPREQVRLIYYWIDKHIPWAGALEYSIIPNIPEYVLTNQKGDCGMQTLLFMTMARYKGIPVKWQSGWMMHPGNVNLHDWCEVYYEGIGWVPLDMSFGLQKSDNKKVKEFYVSGLDAYRLVVNDNIGAAFSPSKQFFRSEPWDFQRGEVEWDGGNVYFNQWHYHMDVEYQEGIRLD